MNEQEWKDLDFLQVAKEMMRDMAADPTVNKSESAQVVLAAAAIALVERMDKLVAERVKTNRLLSLVVDTDSGAIRTASWALPV